jgi:hypothetical protein
MKLEISWFAIPISLIIGIFLAWLVYRKQLNKPLSKWLLGLRALGWTLVLIMLFEPTISWITSREVKPLIVLYRDASKSANLDTRDQSLRIKNLVKDRFNNEIDLELIAFGSELMGESWDSLSLSTDLPWIRLSNDIGGETRYFEVIQSLLEIKKRNNVVGSILITDGILNSGPSPLRLSPQKNKPFLIIGTGDSSRISDVCVESLICNDDVFLGNNIRIEGELEFQNWTNSEVKLDLLEDGRIVQSKIIQVGLTNYSGKQGKNASSSVLRRQYQFDYVGRIAGAHFLQVQCSSSQDKNLKNNLLGKSIRVVDRKKKIAIIYGKPHPDIKAIAESLSTMVQNEVLISSENDLIPSADLFILHGIENARSFETIEKTDAPIWVFANTPASLVYANKNSGVSVSNISRISTFQSVGLAANSEFSLFEWGMDDLSNKNVASISNVKLQNIWGGVSAVLVKLKASSSSMTQIKQVWNSTVTDFPLCNLNVKGTVSSVWFWGEGIWKCRMNEFRKRNSTQYFDAWLNSNVQWVGRNPSENNGLKIVTSGDEVQLGKLSRFKVIRLDAAGNKTNSENIEVQMVNSQGQTKELNVLKSENEYVGNFIPSSDGLMKIKVRLKGNSAINAEKLVQVNSYSLEEKSNRSNFNLLRNMAKNHDGDFVLGLKSDPTSPEKEGKLSDAFLKQIEDWITQNKLNQIKLVDENRSLRLKEFWGYLTLIAVVFTIEWILRKRVGQF